MSTQGASGHDSDNSTEFNDIQGSIISFGISLPETAKIEGQDQHAANPLPRAKPHSNISSISTQGASDHGSDGGTKHNDHPDGVPASSIGHVDPASIEGQDKHATNSRFRTTSHSSIAGSSIQKLHQTQLDMGAPAIKACKECGMHYNTTLDGDRRNHTKYHNGIVQAKQLHSVQFGVDLEVDYIGADRHTIREYDYRIQDIHKDRAYKALQLASHDLGGIIPTPDELWSLITNPQNKNDRNQVPRFKLYLYLINMDPVGLLLAERIAGGGDYYFGVFPSPSDKTVYMCVERIWVREDMRRKGVASRLVDKARTCFIRGLCCRKLEYAFSRPTELGRKFADSYVVKSLQL
jgi:GNAT superfamily N-acetyltransferase